MSSWDPVYRLVRKIPRGRVTTYGAVAKALRLRGGARAAGHAMAACPSGSGIPWHRVVVRQNQSTAGGDAREEEKSPAQRTRPPQKIIQTKIANSHVLCDL